VRAVENTTKDPTKKIHNKQITLRFFFLDIPSFVPSKIPKNMKAHGQEKASTRIKTKASHFSIFFKKKNPKNTEWKS
jgi:hypothetical protein